ncbi:unnamed protein product, partial [marine sediment metagenome]
RPTPEKFAHLRRWVEPVKRDIKITSIAEMTDIDQQLEQNANLFVDNIISRVIAQLIGKYGKGFVTLEATEDGHLITQNERESKTNISVAIAFNDGADETIVAGVAGVTIKITSIMFTVAGETNIKFKDGTDDLTGPMDFGGTDEPRGAVITQGFLPWTITTGRSFIIESSEAVQVSGVLTGYLD